MIMKANRRGRRGHPIATAPTNVRIEYADGVIVPVDCRYIGWDSNAMCHDWSVINPRPNEVPLRMTIDVLPERCRVIMVGAS